ncbi:MAG TPA: hypothetical protein VGF76_11100, partial [Polyangiaceae bacterium]
MSDSALEFAEERALGKVLGRVRLGSGIPIADGSRSQATLLLTSSGLWLVAARDRFHGVQVDLLTRGDVRLVAGRIRDRLYFGQETLIIPAGRRHAVERLFALARLASAPRGHVSEAKPSRLVSEPDELGKAWLARELAESEVLVCWLRGASSLTLESHVVGPSQARPYLFVSERRAAIVAWSPVGDVAYTPLHADSLRMGARGEQTELSGAGTFLGRRSDAQATRDAFELILLSPGKTRLLEAARRLWLTREQGKQGKQDTAHSLSLLQAAVTQGSQRARFARLLALAEDTDSTTLVDRSELTHALSEGRLTPLALAELWANWKFSEHAGRAVVRGLIDTQHEPFALALQRRMQSAPSADDAVARDELRLVRFGAEQRLARGEPSDQRDIALGQVLAEHGLNAAPVQLASPSNALPGELFEGALSHPLARGQGSLVASVQKLIAHSPEPDHGALSDYCEALDAREHPEARRAL